ncbi:MAG: methyltransferase domain-containing protein [Labilibaculum sp.]|nr:methyltransferase domain-containing protein [Labilibaculum sp.]
MNMKLKCKEHHKSKIHMNHRGSKGPSSFGMHDSVFAFEKLDLKPGNTFLDLGCGAGDYSLYAAKLVGELGNVYALDMWNDIVEGVARQAEEAGLLNVHAKVSDIYEPLEMEDQSIDVCMLATVLHSKNVIEKSTGLFQEIKRVLKSEGRLVIIECKKEESSFGPLLEFRLAPEELEEALGKLGFEKISYTDLGYNYMLVFDF